MYGHYFPEARVDGVEIDGELTEIGERVLRPRRPRTCHTYTEDARPWLRALRRRLRRDRRRRLPPALHPVLPGDEGVLRAGPRPARPGRRRDRQRRPSRGQRRSRDRARLDDGRRRSRPSCAIRSRTPTRCCSAARPRPRRTTCSPRPPSSPTRSARTSRSPNRSRIGPRLPGDEVYTDDHAPVEWLIDKSILGYAGDN